MSDQFFKFGKKIIGVGRNYAYNVDTNISAHAKELGNTVPKDPILFLKPTTSYLLQNQGPILIPLKAHCHYEVELGVVIGSGGKKISKANAMNHIVGYVTARNWQKEAQKNGEPWSIAKGCDTFTPISSFVAQKGLKNINDCSLGLKLNGKSVQNGKISDMVFDIPTLISYISSKMTLERGDLILTGTPEGVGEFKDGDVLNGFLEENGSQIVDFRFDAKLDSI